MVRSDMHPSRPTINRIRASIAEQALGNIGLQEGNGPKMQQLFDELAVDSSGSLQTSDESTTGVVSSQLTEHFIFI